VFDRPLDVVDSTCPGKFALLVVFLVNLYAVEMPGSDNVVARPVKLYSKSIESDPID
jgi:hypothetical protein